MLLTFKYLRLFASRAKELKDSVIGTAQSISKDAQSVASNFKQAVQDDFRTVRQAASDTADKIDAKVRGTDQERTENAETSAENKYFFSEHSENPLNKAAKTAHEAKEAVKDKAKNTYETAKDTMDSAKGKYDSTKQSAKNAFQSTSAQDTVKTAEQKATDAAMRAQHSSEGYSEPST